MADSFSLDDVALFRAAVMRLSRRIRTESSDEVLSFTELSVLGRVLREEQTPGALARAEHVQPPSMTKIVERLEAQGFLERRPHPTDGRQQLIAISDAGQDFIERTRRDRTKWLDERLAELTPAERSALFAGLPALQRLGDLP